MTNVIFISHELMSNSDNKMQIQQLSKLQGSRIEFVVFDNDSHHVLSDSYAASVGIASKQIENVLWHVAADDYAAKMSDRISLYLTSESWKNLQVKAFVILDTDNAPMHKAFPNNFVKVESLIAHKDISNVDWILSGFGKDREISNREFFIADTHFFHANIIKYCNRPWNSGKDSDGKLIVTDDDVEKMNQALISNWNNVVGPDDTVWHLGDFCFGKNKIERAKEILKQLNGKVNLVLGNHDLSGSDNIKKYYDAGFNKVYDRSILINGYVILSHVPMLFLNDNCPFVNIAGHVHDSTAFSTWTPTQVIVSVERHNYSPVSWETIYAKLNELNKND